MSCTRYSYQSDPDRETRYVEPRIAFLAEKMTERDDEVVLQHEEGCIDGAAYSWRSARTGSVEAARTA